MGSEVYKRQTYVCKVVVINRCSTVRIEFSKLVTWADEEIVADNIFDHLRVFAVVIDVFPMGILCAKNSYQIQGNHYELKVANHLPQQIQLNFVSN